MGDRVKKGIIVFIIGLVGIGAYFFLAKQEGQVSVEYQKVNIKNASLSIEISATGEVKPQNRLEIKPPVAGRIEEILIEEGDEVKKGQVIGQYSSAERVALIDTARGKGGAELKRWEEFYKAIPIVSPISGVVISRSVEVGQTLQVSDVIVTISNKLIVVAQVDETDVAKVKKGQEVSIVIDAYPDNKITGQVSHVAYEATTEDNVVVYEVDIRPNEVPDFMKSGMSVEVNFVVQKLASSLVIPTNAILYEDGKAYLYRHRKQKTNEGEGWEKVFLKIGQQVGNQTQLLDRDISADLFTQIKIQRAQAKKEESSNPFLPKRPKRSKSKKK